MKVVILAGGRGSRLGVRTRRRPKPLQPIGPRPILWFIIRHFAAHGFRDFVVATGYLGDTIERYFNRPDLELDGCRIQFMDTGLDSSNGQRLVQVAAGLEEGPFFLSWADAVSNVNFQAVRRQHLEGSVPATVVAVHPPERFGRLTLDGSAVTDYREKRSEQDCWASGGYFVLDRNEVLLHSESLSSFERDFLEPLAGAGQLAAYRHDGFWQCMDLPSEHDYLTEIWNSGTPQWTW